MNHKEFQNALSTEEMGAQDKTAPKGGGKKQQKDQFGLQNGKEKVKPKVKEKGGTVKGWERQGQEAKRRMEGPKQRGRTGGKGQGQVALLLLFPSSMTRTGRKGAGMNTFL